MKQKMLFWQSTLMAHSDVHLKMAELQSQAGREDLAEASKKTALSRRIASRNIEGFRGDVKQALDYGEWAVAQNL